MVKAVVIVVLWLMASATVCQSFSEAKKGVENVKERVSQAASKSTSAMNSAASESAKYISEKAGEVGSLAFEKAGQAIDMAKETVKDKVADNYNYNNVSHDDVNMKAYEAYAYVTELAQESLKKIQTMAGVVEETTEKKQHYAYDSISERAGKAMNIGSDIAQNDEETVNDDKPSDFCKHASEKADQKIQMSIDKGSEIKESMETYEAANEKASDADENAKHANNSIKELVKETYEADKEKTSDAAGNVGEAMRT